MKQGTPSEGGAIHGVTNKKQAFVYLAVTTPPQDFAQLNRAQTRGTAWGAHSRFGHKAMIGSDHRVLALEWSPDLKLTQVSAVSFR